MEFYKVLLQIMEDRSLSIPDIARSCGLSDSTIRSVINRKQKSVALDVAFLAKKSQWLASCADCHADDLRALSDEDAFLGIQAVAQLGFRQCGKEFNARRLQRIYMYDWHWRG